MIRISPVPTNHRITIPESLFDLELIHWSLSSHDGYPVEIAERKSNRQSPPYVHRYFPNKSGYTIGCAVIPKSWRLFIVLASRIVLWMGPDHVEAVDNSKAELPL